MHDLNRIVIPNIAAEWKEVAYALGYKIAIVKHIKKSHREAKECCMELFEDWLTTTNGTKPKTWQTLLNKLKRIDALDAATKQITEELIQMNSQVSL